MPQCCSDQHCGLSECVVQGEYTCPVCEKDLHGAMCGVNNGDGDGDEDNDDDDIRYSITCQKCVNKHHGQAYLKTQWGILRQQKKRPAGLKRKGLPEEEEDAPSLLQVEFGVGDAAIFTAATATPLVATNSSKTKKARKSSGFAKTLTKESWYRICSLYRHHHHSNMSQVAFLRSPVSGTEVSGTQSDQQVFSKRLKEFDAGTLQPSSAKRQKDPQFPEGEKKIVQYVKFRLQRHKREKLGITWAGLTQMAKEFAEQEPDQKYRNFSASSGWMQRLMRRNGITNVNSPWVISDLEGAEEAMEELKSFAHSKGLSQQDINLLAEFSQKLRQRVIENPL